MKKLTVLFVVIAFSTHALFAGGPWLKPKGKGYYKLSEWWTVFDQHYTDTGLLDPNVTTGIFNTSLYAEHGIHKRLNLLVNATLFSRNYMNNVRSRTTDELIIPGEALNSVGDIDLGVKYGLSKPGSKIPISATLILGIPTGTPAGGTQNNLQTGDGEFNQILQIDAGSGFQLGKTSAYLSAYAGINNRTKGFSEEFRYGLEFGLGLLKNKLWISSKLNAIESFKNGFTAETVTSTSVFANNAEFTSLAFETNVFISKNFGVSANAAGAFRGEIIAAAPSYSVGVFYDLK